MFTNESVTAFELMVPEKHWTAAFNSYQQLKSDPLNSITNAFSKLKTDEGAAVQFVLRPIKQGWQNKLQKEASELINPKKKGGGAVWNPVTWIRAIFNILGADDSPIDLKDEEHSTGERVSQAAEEYSKALDEKANNPGYQVIIRLVTSAKSTARAELLLY